MQALFLKAALDTLECMYGHAWLKPASCPKKASCLLHLLRWDSDASATLLFVPNVCEMNLEDLSEASKITTG